MIEPRTSVRSVVTPAGSTVMGVKDSAFAWVSPTLRSLAVMITRTVPSSAHWRPIRAPSVAAKAVNNELLVPPSALARASQASWSTFNVMAGTVT